MNHSSTPNVCLESPENIKLEALVLVVEDRSRSLASFLGVEREERLLNYTIASLNSVVRLPFVSVQHLRLSMFAHRISGNTKDDLDKSSYKMCDMAIDEKARATNPGNDE